MFAFFSCTQLFAQENKEIKDSISETKEKENWFKRNNVEVRQTFDGSTNEKKPASIVFFKDHESGNDFFNIDLAVKLTEWESKNELFLIYPVLEWHKSSNKEGEKDKLSAGINTESLIGNGEAQPYIVTNLILARNFLDNVSEFEFSSKFTLLGINNKFMPGYQTRFNNYTYTFRYYPYLGYEYHIIPELISVSETEKFSMFFLSFYADLWIDKTNTFQIIAEGTYRNTMNTIQGIRKDLPIVDVSFNWYPLSQDNFSIGINHRNGYDPDSKYQKVQITSISANVKF